MKGDVFAADQIDPYIVLKLEEFARFEIEPQRTEFAMCCGMRPYPRLEALPQLPVGVIDVRFWQKRTSSKLTGASAFRPKADIVGVASEVRL